MENVNIRIKKSLCYLASWNNHIDPPKDMVVIFHLQEEKKYKNI